jgi:hypothetical protein
MSAQIVPLRKARSKRNMTSSPKGRKNNTAYRVHEHLKMRVAVERARLKAHVVLPVEHRSKHRDILYGVW